MTAHTASSNRHDMPIITKSSSNDTTNNTLISTLGPYDVLFGRRKASFNNIGNRRFRIMISMNLKAYLSIDSRSEKSVFFKNLVAYLKTEVGVRFLKPVKGGGYVELGLTQVREKIGHALRDLAVYNEQLSCMSEWRQQPQQQQGQNRQVEKSFHGQAESAQPAEPAQPAAPLEIVSSNVTSHSWNEIAQIKKSFQEGEIINDSSIEDCPPGRFL